MATLRTLIARAEADTYPAPSRWANALRAASKRVIVREEDAVLVAYVDGVAAYRTGARHDGLWAWAHGDGDGWQEYPDGRIAQNYSWHQIVGTAQLSGRPAVRAYVVERLAGSEA